MISEMYAQDDAAHAVLLLPLDDVDLEADEDDDGDEVHDVLGLVLLHPLLLPLLFYFVCVT